MKKFLVMAAISMAVIGFSGCADKGGEAGSKCGGEKKCSASKCGGEKKCNAGKCS